MAETSHELHEWATLIPWRRSRLRHAGFDAALAAQLASDMRYDLHSVLDLVDRGCPAPLAARILAPLDGERP
jgi:hypothetical protein